MKVLEWLNCAGEVSCDAHDRCGAVAQRIHKQPRPVGCSKHAQCIFDLSRLKGRTCASWEEEPPDVEVSSATNTAYVHMVGWS
jgi:hypothetical protein